MAPLGTRIAAVDAEMPWGAAVNGMVLCGSAMSAVSTHRVTDQPQQMASATVLVNEKASVYTGITAVDAEMAWCNSAGDRQESNSMEHLIEHSMEHSMEHSVCSAAAASECSPPLDV